MAEGSPLSGARRFGLRAPIDPISPALNMQLGRVSSPDAPNNYINICLLALPIPQADKSVLDNTLHAYFRVITVPTAKRYETLARLRGFGPLQSRTRQGGQRSTDSYHMAHINSRDLCAVSRGLNMPRAPDKTGRGNRNAAPLDGEGKARR